MKFKKFAAIILSLSIILAMSIPTFAADTAIEVNTENISEVISGATEDISIKLTEDIQANRYEGIYYEFIIADGVTVTVDANGYKFDDITFSGGSVVINGDIGSLNLRHTSAVINGNITGSDGNKEACDMTDPEDSEDGNTALYLDANFGIPASADETESNIVNDILTITVNGNVTGGKSYGTYGYGGTAIHVYGNNFNITVNGNVTGGDVEADPNVESIKGYESMGGNAIALGESNATVTINGDATGGSTNGHNGFGGAAITAENSDDATVTVNGKITSGSGANKYSSPIIYYYDMFIPTALDLGDFVIPTPDDFETFADADDYYGTKAIVDIMTVCEANGIDDYEPRDFYIAYMADIITELFGEDFMANITSAEEIKAAFDTLTQEQRDKYLDDAYNCLTYVLTGEGKIQRNYPTITVYKIVDTNGTGVVTCIYYDEDINDYACNTEMVKEAVSSILYFVKVKAGENGTVSASAKTAKMGETIDITATANDGYKVSQIYVNSKEIKAVDGKYSYVMTDNTGIEISAEFEKAPAIIDDAPNNTDNDTKSPATSDNTVLPIIAILLIAAIVFTKKKTEA